MKLFSIDFEHGLTAQAVSLADATEIPTALDHFGVATACPTLVLVGGASGLAPDDLEKLRSLFTEVLCPLIATLNLTVIDGGTDAGVMQLMGQSRIAAGCSFPLMGVVVERKAILPNAAVSSSEDAAVLEPHHNHFFLVPGESWGDESSWIAQIASAIANDQPSITLLINGGAIALHQDVPNSLTQKRPVLVIGGSGRAADRLARAVSHQEAEPELQDMVNSGLIDILELNTATVALKAKLEEVFGTISAQPVQKK